MLYKPLLKLQLKKILRIELSKLYKVRANLSEEPSSAHTTPSQRPQSYTHSRQEIRKDQDSCLSGQSEHLSSQGHPVSYEPKVKLIKNPMVIMKNMMKN